MIRRWSHINNLNNFINVSSNFEKNFKITIFKKSTNYKRFISGITKFRRKSLIRLKHRTSWLIYTSVIQFWIKDYMFNKHFLRFQFFEKICPNNFFFYNFNFIKNRNDTIFYNFNFVFSTLSKQSYFYFFFNKFNYFKNNNITFIWYYKNCQINASVTPSYLEHHSNFFPIEHSLQVNYDFFNFFNFFNFFLFNKIKEFRKIVTLLFYCNLHV